MVTDNLEWMAGGVLVVAASVVGMGRRMVIWMVAATASFEAIGAAVLAAIHGDLAAVAVWTGVALMVALVAGSIERVKQFLEE